MMAEAAFVRQDIGANALVMESSYQDRLNELFSTSKTKAGTVLMFILHEMNENNEFVSNLDNIADALQCSRMTVARAVAQLREQYSDLVTVSRKGIVSKFVIDKNKCFRA